MKKITATSIGVSLLLLTIIVFTSMTILKEPDFSGEWKYEVRKTPYGDFLGTIFLRIGKDNKYTGEIINSKGKKFTLAVLKVKDKTMIFNSNIEDTQSLFTCHFDGDILTATIEIKGDDFPYKLTGKKVSKN